MVVLSAAILSKSGEVLLARQFVDITKTRLDGLLSFFPKNVGQGQILDTHDVRFLYQSINQSINAVNQWEPSYNQAPGAQTVTQAQNQGVWVILITNKQSNIVEDLETLQLIVKLLPEYAPINQSHGQPIEQTIKQYVFEILGAVDEAINPGGQSANQSISAIKTFTAMESHEEKLQLIIQSSKIKEAKIEASRKAEEIEQQRRIKQALHAAEQANQSSYSRSYEDQDPYRNQSVSQPVEREKPAVSQPSTQSNQPIKKGMSLGAKKTGDTFFDQLSKEEKLAPVVRPTVEQSSSQSSTQAQSSSQYGVQVVAKERISVEVDRDGSATSVVISGDLKCCVYDPNDSKIAIHIGQATSQSLEQLGYKAQLHPKMDKKAWAGDKIVTVADSNKGLPIGSDNALVMLKWRKKGSDSDVPFALTYWQNQESKNMAVNVEFSLQDDVAVDLQNVQIRIPVDNTPDVSQIVGEYRYDPRGKMLTWIIPVINSENPQGSLDFTCSNSDYPINVDFTSDALLSGLVIEKVQDVNDAEREVNAQIIHRLEVEKYVIGAAEE